MLRQVFCHKIWDPVAQFRDLTEKMAFVIFFTDTLNEVQSGALRGSIVACVTAFVIQH